MISDGSAKNAQLEYDMLLEWMLETRRTYD